MNNKLKLKSKKLIKKCENCQKDFMAFCNENVKAKNSKQEIVYITLCDNFCANCRQSFYINTANHTAHYEERKINESH